MSSWKESKTSQKILMISVVALTIVALSVVISMANQVEYGTLFVGLSDEDAGTIITQLQDEGVDVRSAPGGTLLVPKGQVQELKYKLQSQGLPAPKSFDYSIYTGNATSFGATDKDKAFYEQAQLQQNLVAMINDQDKIERSMVLLSLADTSAFVISDTSNTTSTATVSVMLKDGVNELNDSDVAAIRAIVAGGVPMIKEADIQVVDQYMHSYGLPADGTGGSSGTSGVDKQLDLQNKVSQQLNAQIVNLLTPMFGANNFKSSVNVLLDFDKKTTNSLTLSPPTTDAQNMGIITSMEQTVERLQNAGTTPQGQPGMDPNGGAPTYPEIDQAAADSTYYNVVTKVNTEVNEVNQQIEEAQGDITDLSAAITINGGAEVQAVLADVSALVAAAIGAPENKIVVRASEFVEDNTVQQMMEQQAQYIADQQRMQLITGVIVPLAIVGAIILTLLLIMASIRKKQRKEREAQRLREEAERRQQLYEEQMAAGGGIDLVADDETTIESLLNEKRDDTLSQVKDFVDNNPQMIAQLLKNWLSDEFGGTV